MCADFAKAPAQRLCRGRERRDRISLGRGSIRATAGAGGRTRSPTSRRHRHGITPVGPCGQGSNHDDSHRLPRTGRPGRAGLVASLARPGGNAPGSTSFRLSGGKATGAPAPARARRHSCGRASQSGQPSLRRNHMKDEKRGPRPRAPNPCSQRQHQPRDRCSLRSVRARAAGRPLVGGDAFFHSRRVQLVQLATRYAVPATYARA